MTTTKKLFTIALAATALAVGSLGATGDAFAKGKGWHGGWHHEWHGRHFYGRHFHYSDYGYRCLWIKKYHGRFIKICPDYF